MNEHGIYQSTARQSTISLWLKLIKPQKIEKESFLTIDSITYWMSFNSKLKISLYREKSEQIDEEERIEA